LSFNAYPWFQAKWLARFPFDQPKHALSIKTARTMTASWMRAAKVIATRLDVRRWWHVHEGLNQPEAIRRAVKIMSLMQPET
jgi:hypothetical protein